MNNEDVDSGGGDVGVKKAGIENELDLIGSENLDVTDFINMRFPTEESLDNDLESFLENLKEGLRSLDAELEEIVRIERHGGAKSAMEVAAAVEQIQNLKTAIARVSVSAHQAEVAVSDATRDIKPLDCARRNLIETSEGLKNLVDLEAAITKLENAAEAKDIVQIGASSHLLADVERILKRFDRLPNEGGLPRLVNLRKRASALREKLRLILLDEFEEISRKITTKEKYEMAMMRLKSACQVTNDLGPDLRKEVVGHYVGSRLAAFQTAFSDISSHTLSSLDKRFAWLRREQRVHEEKGIGTIFPTDWGVSRRICEVICNATSKFIDSQLGKEMKEVHSMVLALQRTVEFENELEAHSPSGETGEVTFVGIMSTCFEPYMSAFVTDEDENLSEILNDLLRNESWMSSSTTHVLKSSTELFLHIQKSVRRCAQLTTSKTFFNMHRIYKKTLLAYVQALTRRLPPREAPVNTSDSETKETKVKWENDAKRLCAIVETADYCASTTEQLEDSLRKQVDEAFEDQINMKNEVDQFIGLSGKAIKSLVSLTVNRLEPALNFMTKTNWSNVTRVGDSSNYVSTLTRIVHHAIQLVRQNFAPAHYRVFCDNLVCAFVPRFTSSLYRCRQMSGTGAQQVLLDASVIKTLLQDMLTYGLEGEKKRKAASHAFLDLVNAEMLRPEGILKLVLTEPENFADTYVVLFEGGNLTDFQQLLELKGVGKEAPAIIADYTSIMRATGLSLETQTNANTEKSSDSADLQRLAAAGQNTVGSMKNLFGRLSNTIMDSNLQDRLRISETAADMLKRGLGSR